MDRDLLDRRCFLKTIGATALALPEIARIDSPQGPGSPGATNPGASGSGDQSLVVNTAPREDEPWKRSSMGLPHIVGEAGETPVYGFGRISVWAYRRISSPE